MDGISERVAGLEQAGTLDRHHRAPPAQQQPGGHGDRFTLAADADKPDVGAGPQGRLPGA